MTAREETLLRHVLAKPVTERPAFLDAACTGQPDLRVAVEALLTAQETLPTCADRPRTDLGETTGPAPDGAADADDPLRTTDHVPAHDSPPHPGDVTIDGPRSPETGNATLTLQPRP